jgi:hypothetical protein
VEEKIDVNEDGCSLQKLPLSDVQWKLKYANDGGLPWGLLEDYWSSVVWAEKLEKSWGKLEKF